MSAPSAPVSILGKIFKYSFYLSMLALMIFILLVGLHFAGIQTFSFGPNDSGGILSVPTPQSQQIAFQTKTATPDLSCNFIDLYPLRYTVSIDVSILGEFYTMTTPRILLYRSNLAIQLNPQMTASDLTTTFPSSNLLIYLDPVKNDIYVSILTEGGVRYTTEAIQNVPLREPFRLIVVLSENFAEVYLKGDLVSTLPLPKKPISSPPEAYFFGPPSIVNQAIRVANIMYWNFEVPSKTIRSIGSTTVPTSVFNT